MTKRKRFKIQNNIFTGVGISFCVFGIGKIIFDLDVKNGLFLIGSGILFFIMGATQNK